MKTMDAPPEVNATWLVAPIIMDLEEQITILQVTVEEKKLVW